MNAAVNQASDFRAKVLRSKDIIASVVGNFKRPVVACSFGKDSMVLVHLCNLYGWPVLFVYTPWKPRASSHRGTSVRTPLRRGSSRRT